MIKDAMTATGYILPFELRDWPGVVFTSYFSNRLRFASKKGLIPRHFTDFFEEWHEKAIVNRMSSRKVGSMREAYRKTAQKYLVPKNVP